MRTVSLRRRVTLTAAAVSGIALLAVALLVHSLFGVVINRSENAVLTDRAQLARQLAQADTPPTVLITRVDNRSVRARLTLADGRVYGSLGSRHEEDGAARPRVIVLTGPGELNRAHLTLQVDTPLLTRLQSRLGWVLAGATTAAIAVIAAGLWFGVRRALAPLDSMTRLAREIARGERGRRLTPDRADTELGRTAAAFDEMLDALEGAEARARASEQHLRSFLADAAHELRTPVAGIRAIAEAVLHQPPGADPEDQQRLHLLLAREAQRAGRLVEDLLDMARIDAGLHLHRTPVDLYDLAATHVDRTRMLHPGIDFQLTGPHLVATVDPDRIGQILTNLLGNACQALTPEPPAAVTVALTATPTTAEITVADNGPGIPTADRDRIFDRLVRLDPARDRRPQGSGLGLAIARGIARAHDGDLTCEPTSSGALFTLHLNTGPVSGAVSEAGDGLKIG
ncbi:sensor histidine kinase [Nocardia sp. alder85J]|uniref:sensor histidine kinase n=1 Tax=Nocardia sp. alder85J TaxID=2862949 RepID=UPI001CD53F02|nr:HAMP domain-containing sensor histidine kinase [Nocardia sp. alder85J]MCX4096013.1 HAMP domain-containing sensor histidine kinase [Nocardia sp. alder85J]